MTQKTNITSRESNGCHSKDGKVIFPLSEILLFGKWIREGMHYKHHSNIKDQSIQELYELFKSERAVKYWMELPEPPCV